MRKLTDEEIAQGAKEFWKRGRVEDPRQSLLERQLPFEYVTETQEGDTVVTARVTDRDGKTWEGSARGSEPTATLKREAFQDLEVVVQRAAAGVPRGGGDVRRISRMFTFPTLPIYRERDRNIRAGMSYGMDLDGDFGMYAEITDPAGRVWKAGGGDLLEVNRAIRRLLEDAVASGDDGAKAVLAAIDARPPPRPRPEPTKKSGA